MNILKRLIVVITLIILLTFFFAACNYEKADVQYPESEYDMKLSLDANSKKLNGTTQITYYSRIKGLSEISLQLHPNAYREVVVNDQYIEDAYPKGRISYGGITIHSVSSATHEVSSYTTVYDNMTVMRVKMTKPLKQGEKVILDFEYTVDIPKANHRLGYNDYVFNIANFYPILCVFEEGNFVEYDYYKIGDPFYSESSCYNVEMALPKNYVLAHSGMCNQVTYNDNNIIYNITAQNIRDFAMVASPYFILKTEMLNDTKIMYYYINETNSNARLAHIKSVLEAFNEYFGEYPYPTITVVKTAFAFGGMEYPQLVYISDTLSEADTNMVITHELAHQWWYGLVGNDQVKYAWLDESLAEFSTYHYLKKKDYNKYKSYYNTSYDAYVRYSTITGLTGYNAAMNQMLFEYDDYRYTANVYIKGMLMLDSLYEVKGDALIFALKQYALDNRYKIATPKIFVDSISTSLQVNLKSYFDAWLLGRVILQ